MFKKTTFIVSMLMSGIFIVACSAISDNSGANQTLGTNTTSLPTHALTEVASIVNSASTGTQNAARTPIIAGGSTGTPGPPARTPAGPGLPLTTQSEGTLAAAQGA